MISANPSSAGSTITGIPEAGTSDTVQNLNYRCPVCGRIVDATSAEEILAKRGDFTTYFAAESGTEIWQLWLLAGQTSHVIEQCIANSEPAYLAKHTFQLAQQFNNFYHRHHILTEEDEGRKHFLMTTAAVVRRELIKVLGVMGIEAPQVM